MTPTRRIRVDRAGRSWKVEVEGVAGTARFTADSLAEAERTALRLVGGHTGAIDDVDLDIHLPAATADRLWLVAEYRRDLEYELQTAFRELIELGLCDADIERVIDACLKEPSTDGEGHSPPDLRAVGRPPWSHSTPGTGGRMVER